MILKSLLELHEVYNPIIQNPCYLGSMEIYPSFIIKTIAEKIGRTVQTTRKWCHILTNEKIIIRGYKRCYTGSDPMTYCFRLTEDVIKPIKLIREKRTWNSIQKEIEDGVY